MITAAMYRIGVSLFQCHINILITQLPANSYVLIAQMDENIRLFEKKKKSQSCSSGINRLQERENKQWREI